ncbi:MAG: hypothetical protein NVV63_13605 [Opitutus sp.]|nr:hypothetical protein [Opitutus sp.]
MNLAIFGNIITSWSWFGTNMLGVGLHSYGFTDAAFSHSRRLSPVSSRSSRSPARGWRSGAASVRSRFHIDGIKNPSAATGKT